MSSNRRWPKVISRSASSAHFSPMTFIAASIEQTRGSAILGVRTPSAYAWTSGFAITIHLDSARRGRVRLWVGNTNPQPNEGAPMELHDQRVLVTGSTAGIGRQTAMLFARRGATVIITGRDTERGAQTVAAIEAEGGRAEFIAAELNNIESVRRLAEQVGEVDVLVNNAAVHTFAPTLEQDVESFDRTFDVSVKAPFFLTAAL